MLQVYLVLCLAGLASALFVQEADLGSQSTMPCPFTRQLRFESKSPMHGNDVLIAQTLLARTPGVKLTINSQYDKATSVAVSLYQKLHSIPSHGRFDAATAESLLKTNSDDGWRDPNGAKPVPEGYLYKLWVPVQRNRSIEVTATLFAANGTVLRQFTVRAQGQPHRNQFCSLGDTPTGYGYFDLNSPEPDPKSFGPYPVNRVAWGLEGNQQLLLADDANTIRNGILMHTGEWDNWHPGDPMPRSDGCIHGYPHDIKEVWKILVSIGVHVRKNPFGERPYPFHPQGVISVSLADDDE